jgi:hypothetical protein
MTNKHATGFSLKNISEMHQYLKIRGGFLRVDGTPQLTFRHHGTDGKILNEDIQHEE